MEDSSKVIIALLEKYDITYWLEGRNVSQNTINIQCPFCEDQSNHCGIFKDSLGYHCWKCDTSGSFDYLLARVTSQDIERIKEEIADLGFSFEVDPETQVQDLWREGESQPEPKQEIPNSPLTLPPYFELITPSMHFPLLDWYLNLRGYTRDIPIQYRCGVCTVGPWMNRMIIPVMFKGELVSYQGADLTRRAQVKYKTAPGEINNYLYRWDMIDWSKDYVILVEGVLDTWRFGDNALATFGTHLTDRQTNLIIGSNVRKVIMAWDGDAYFHSMEQAEELNTFVPEVSVVKFLSDEDPDSFGLHYGIEALREMVLNTLVL